MDTRASDGCAALSEPELLNLVARIKAQRTGAPSLSATIDALATAYQGQLSQLRATAIPSDISNPNASTVLFQAFLSDITQLHTEFSSQAMAEYRSVEEQTQCMRLVGRAWDALIYGECLDATNPVTAWLEEWVITAASALMHLGRCRLDVCIDNGLDPKVAARLEQYHRETNQKTPVLGIVVDSSLMVSAGYDDMDDEDLQISVVEQRRRKYYAHMGRDSQTACIFINGCAAVCQMLVNLGILKHMRSRVLGSISRIARDSADARKGQWSDALLESTVYGVRLATATFEALLLPDHRTHGTASSQAGTLVDYAEHIVYQRFADLRTSELFGIIIDYPDSHPAINDLRTCVSRLRNMQQVAGALRDAIQRRLLHPGATTGDILTQYISAIRCLRLLDPSSTVLEIVARPIRTYLRSRSDTVSCIVQDMVSEESELFEDLSQQRTLIMDNDPEGTVYDEEYADTSWEPLPVEAKTVYRSAQRRDADVLSLLVSIYDTKDVFVHEFETHLERQLLEQGNSDYTTDREIKQVEMMKLRFGDQAMARCEVMLKDIADSKRIAQNVMEASVSNSWHMPLRTIVVSRQFWSPQLPSGDQFTMPSEMADFVDKYARVYQTLKPARTLEWRNTQGHVSLDIELADRTLELTVKPAQAAVLFAFQERECSLSLGELAKILESTEEFVLLRVRFWQARGVVRETSHNTFVVAETELSGEQQTASAESREAKDADRNDTASGSKHPADARDNRMDVNSDDGSEEEEEEEEGNQGASATASNARTEALRVNFKYIVGMLTNLGPLPLDRILSMLSMFIPGEATTSEEMRDFLAQMVREDKLEMSGGMYKLKQ
ncbi:Anaphase-promoting complex subunit 2 [Coemansia sp. RSA 986]|nr:Anaphase-promoting complex subunit 2 [Coemansia sp. RSA 986]